MKRRSHKHKTPPESKKISKLRHEGVPQDQAVAEAMSMKRARRLTPSGGYRRSKKHSRKRSLK